MRREAPAPGVRATARLRAEPYSSRIARHFVTDTLGAWSCGHLSEEAALLTSELVTNAVLHAGTDIDVTVCRTASGVRIEVADAHPRAVSGPEDNGAAAKGRGLLVVDTLAEDWGVTPARTGKSVWFELPVEPA